MPKTQQQAKQKNFLKENFLLITILVSILIGFILGFLLKRLEYTKEDELSQWLILPGNLFIRSLKMMVVPVVLFGVVAATSTLSIRNNIRMTLICIFLIILTHIIGSMLGLLGSFILKKLQFDGFKLDVNLTISSIPPQKTKFDIVADILRNIIPSNLVKATTHQEITKYVSSNNGSERMVVYVDGTNVLGLLVFAIFLGLGTSVLGRKAELFRDFFRSANDVIILVLKWLVIFSPIGLCSLIIDAVLGVVDLGVSFQKIGLFAIVCSFMLIFYGVFCLGCLVLVLSHKNPVKCFVYFFEAIMLGFASTSGVVCIHKSLEICETKLKMDPRISRFTIPFYTALQSDGSAVFIVMSCLFLGNFAGYEFQINDYCTIIILTCVLCLCLPSVPSSSIVTILVVLNSIELHNSNIAILYTFEWLLDRLRTAVNVASHCACAFITHEFCKKDLLSLDGAARARQDLTDGLLDESNRSENVKNKNETSTSYV